MRHLLRAKLEELLLLWLFPITFVGDLLNKAILTEVLPGGAQLVYGVSPSFVIRMALAACLFVVLYPYIARSMGEFLFFCCVVLLCGVWGSVSVMDTPDFSVLAQFKHGFKPVFFVFMGIVFSCVSASRLERVAGVMEWVMVINSVMALLGVVFDIRLFSAYEYAKIEYRVGFTGAIPAPNEATFFYMAGLALSYFRAFVIGRRGSIVKFLVILASAVFAGTKGLYAFVFALGAYHFLRSLVFVGFWLRVLVAGVLFGVGVGIVVAVFNPEGVARFVETNMSFARYWLEHIDWVTFLLSGRNLKLEWIWRELQGEWSWFNYLIGGANLNRHSAEMDWIDPFLAFGIIGGVMLLVFMRSYVLNFPLMYPFNAFLFVSVVVLAALGGHFLFSAINSPYWAVVGNYLRVHSNVRKNLNASL